MLEKNHKAFFIGCSQYFIELTMICMFIDFFFSLKKFDFFENILLLKWTKSISFKYIVKLKVFVNGFTLCRFLTLLYLKCTYVLKNIVHFIFKYEKCFMSLFLEIKVNELQNFA